MPIITTIGRKQPKIRLLIAAIYVILSIGAVTMVYPFLLMVSTSFTSPVDVDEFRVIPHYFYSNDSLYRKYVESKYNEDIINYDIAFGTQAAKFESVQPPRHINRRFVAEWRRFVAGLPLDYLTVAHALVAMRATRSESQIRYGRFLSEKFHGDLDKLNAAYRGETNTSWMDLTMPVENLSQRNFTPARGIKYDDYLLFKRGLPARYRITVPVDGLFQEYLRVKVGSLDAINKALGAHFASRDQIRLSARIPTTPAAVEWEAFVRKECPVHFIAMSSQATPAYRAYIQRKYASVAAFNRACKTHINSFEQLQLPERAPDGGVALVDWMEFLENTAPISAVELKTSEVLFRSALERKYGRIGRMNAQLGTHFASFDAVAPPYFENDKLEVLEDHRAIRSEFIVHNYREVLGYIALHGWALVNTGILCLALVLTTLTVNPLCAYALSRYNLRSTYKILLFLLATMAFPAEVSAIPNFLLVKQLHLLGTYWAIILPGMASGFSIFLLKGFFDSLPKELYEAATLDGATEIQMFWNITLKLSKPILAVLALGAFTAAYGSFMWAFLVCQDQKMWTLMVWLFQMQTWAPQYVVYAALVLTAIPTLLVFIFCQNIIMRGIIVPSEK